MIDNMNWINSIRRQLCIGARSNRSARRASRPQLALTRLEDRVTPTVDTWTGAVNNLWSDNGNWMDGSAPTMGEDLVFPASATNKTSVYDSALGVSSFGSIDIQDSGYSISTSFAGSLTLTGGLSATYGSLISNFDIDFDPGNGTVSVGAGATLGVGGVVSGTNGLAVSGGGTLQLGGTSPNTYTGATTVATGTTLVLDKTGATAVPGDLSISAGGAVQLAQPDQIADASNITGASGAVLNLNNFSDTIGALNLTAATVATGTGTLTLGGNVTTGAASTASIISGNLDLGGATRTFVVADGAAGTDLIVTANISGTGAGIIKGGAGSAMSISGNNTYDGTTTVSIGGLIVGSADALGATSAGTTVSSGATLGLQGAITLAAEPVTISGNGVGNLGALWSSSGTNTVTGPVTLAANSFIGAESSAPMTISGVIDDQASSYAITKVRSGVVTLAAANTFDGGVTVSAGTLGLSDGGALGTGSATVSSGATLRLSGGITVSNSITVSGAGVSAAGALSNSSGDNVLAGPITLAAASSIGSASGTLTVSGAISDGASSFALTKVQSGTVVLAGANTYDGTTTINAGVLQVDGAITSAVDLAGGTLSGSGTLNGSGITASSGSVDPGTVGGTGILTYANATGLALSSSTTFRVDLNGTTAGTSYDQLVLSSGAALFDPNGATLSVSLGFLPTVNQSFQIVSQTNASAITGRFNGLSQFASFTVGLATFSIGYFSSGITLTVTNVTTPTFTWDGGGTTDNWSDAANWVGDVAPSQPSHLVFPTGALRLTNTNDLTAGSQFASLSVGGAGYTLSGNAINLTGGLQTTYASGSSTVSLPLALQASSAFDVATGGTLVAGGAISGASFGVTKTGGGTLQYAGASGNSYTGATTVNDGRLELNKTAGVDAFAGNLVIGDSAGTGDAVALLAANQIPDAASVSVNEGAAFDLGTFSETFSALAAQAGTVTIGTGAVLTLSTSLTTTVSVSHVTSVIQGAGVLDLGGNTTFSIVMAHDTFFNGTINVDAQISTVIQNGGIVKSGSGILGLSGANTYASATSITGGAIQVQSDSALGTTAGATTVASGASLYFNGTLSVAENLSIAGPGFISSGALTAVFGSATLSGTVDLTANSQIGAAGGATLAVNGVIDDAGSSYGLSVLNGADGRAVLGGSNQFDGAVTVLSGFLRATNSDALGAPASSSSITVSTGASLELSGGITIPSTKTLAISGTPVTNFSKIMSVAGDNTVQGAIAVTGGNNVAFDVAGGTTLTVSGAISGSVDFDKNNTGTLVLTGTNTNTGNVNANGGTLTVNGSLATSAAVLVDGTLGGSGTLPAVTVSSIGTLAPGNSPGLISTGNLAFTDSGSTYAVELNGTTAGAQYDQLNVAGTVNLAGATLATTLSFTPAGGDTFVLISNDSSDAVIGTFAGLSEGGTFLFGGTTFRISYAGGDGNDVTLTVVPQPVLSVTGASVAEGNSGTTALTFTVALSAPSLQTVTVAYATADGTATAGADYTAASGTLTFAPGETTKTVTVLVAGDIATEADETFSVVLSTPVGATIAAGTGTGSITNDDTSRLVLGAMGGLVQRVDPATGQPGAPEPAYAGFAGEVRVSSGDVNGDGVADLITGSGAGAVGGHVKVFDGATGRDLFSFLAFDGFTGGVFVATGDVNGDGFDDLVVSADAGAAPHVKVFSGKDGTLLMSFLAYDARFLGGVRVAVGDVDGDGDADIVTGNGAGAPANVKVFGGKDGALLTSFLAYDSGFTGGVYVAAGDVDGDGFADIVTGSGAGAPGGHVKVFSGKDGALEESFFAFDPGFVGGVRVGTGEVDGRTVVLVGSGPGSRGHFKAYGTNDELLSMFANGFDQGGVYVA